MIEGMLMALVQALVYWLALPILIVIGFCWMAGTNGQRLVLGVVGVGFKAIEWLVSAVVQIVTIASVVGVVQITDAVRNLTECNEAEEPEEKEKDSEE